MTTAPARFVLVLLVLGAAACTLTSSVEIEAEDVVIVEAYLRPGPGQQVFLYRTLQGDSASLRVDDATVVIADGAGSRLELLPVAEPEVCARYDLLPQDRAGSCYASGTSPGFVRPGGTYTLSVTTVDGRVLDGSTTVPGAFEIRRPASDRCVTTGDGFEVLWTSASGSWSYQAVARLRELADGLAALGVEDPPNELELTGLAIGEADTTITFPSEFGVFDRFSLERDVALALQQGLPAGATADIVVAAGDRNFVNWVRGGNFNPSGQVRVPSVVGDGTGVFASLVTRRFTVLTDTSTSDPVCE